MKGVSTKKKIVISKEGKFKDWEKKPVHLAVLGRSGVGKSRLINAIRGIKSKEHPLYAPVGTTETTLEVKQYAHPENPLLVLYDMPGIGTKTFPRENYFKNPKINFYCYDIYMILSADRFMQEEEKFAEEIEKSGKKILFVRTKGDINAEEFDDFKSELLKIKKNCVKNLSSWSIKDKNVFLISSKVIDDPLLDFGKLIECLTTSLPDMKRETILFTLRFNTRNLITLKKDQILSRSRKVALQSAVGGLLPIPGLSIFVDYQLISSTINDYLEILGVTEKGLETLAKKTGVDAKLLKEKYKLKSFDYVEKKVVAELPAVYGIMLEKIAQSEVAETAAKWLIPGLGMTLSAGISLFTTYQFLKGALEIIIEDAEKMLDILLEVTDISLLETT